MRPTSLETLATYCKTRLGHPVITIRVTDQQVQDRIEDAFDFFMEYHGDSSERDFYKHQVTQDDIDNGYLTLPDDVLSVTKLLSFGSSQGVFSPDYQFRVQTLYDILQSGGNLSGYATTMQYLSMMDMIFTGEHSYMFNRFTRRLTIPMNWKTSVVVGQYMVVECYRTMDFEGTATVFDDRILKKLATAYIKKQWGSNMKLHSGIQLPGGVTVNGQQIYDEAVQEITEIEEEIRFRYQEPPMPEVG